MSDKQAQCGSLTAPQHAPSVVSMKKPQPIRLQHEIESHQKENERISENLKLTQLTARLKAAVQQQQRLFAQAS